MSIDIKKIIEIIKLSQNENPLGPSPMALDAVNKYAISMNRYPEPHSNSLKTILAKFHQLSPDQVFVSAGLTEALDIIIRNFIEKSENLIIPKLTFVAYRLLAEVFGVKTRFAKMKNYRIDIDSIIENYDAKTKLIIIANPNNPTSNIITEKELIKLLQTVLPHTYVVIDEAYCQYVSDKDYPDSLKLQKEYPNLIVMRTFSKIYGLAGMRVGYTIAASDIIEKLDYYQAPFTVNNLATVAASAAIHDKEFVDDSFEMNAKSRSFIQNEMINLGYNIVTSQSNFIFVFFDNQQECDVVYNRLAKKKLIARKMGSFGDSKAFRLTIPRLENCKKIIDSLEQ